MHLALDEMGDDFGVGFGLEVVPLRLEFTLQLEVVLDDSVVHHDDPAGAVAMWMSVLLGGPPVRGPAGVADAVQPVDWLGADGVFKIDELACRASKRNALMADERHARGVVSAILHAPQSLQQHWNDRLGPDVPDDPAHGG